MLDPDQLIGLAHKLLLFSQLADLEQGHINLWRKEYPIRLGGDPVGGIDPSHFQFFGVQIDTKFLCHFLFHDSIPFRHAALLSLDSI